MLVINWIHSGSFWLSLRYASGEDDSKLNIIQQSYDPQSSDRYKLAHSKRRAVLVKPGGEREREREIAW